MTYTKFGEKFQDLRLPPGCFSTYKTFFDIEPPLEDPLLMDWKYFKEFLLQILYKRKGNLKMVLNMGWFPECDPSGRFIIKVFKGDASFEKILEFESRSKQKIIDKIEEICKNAVEKKSY